MPEQLPCRPAVDPQAVVALELSDLPARERADHAVDLANSITQRFQPLLYFLHIPRRELRDVLPRHLEVSATGDPVRQVTDENGVEVRHVVAPNDAVVLKDQEGRPEGAAGGHQLGL